MEMTGEYRIEAARDAVWVALNDTEVLKRCLRGCERLERIDDTRMAGTLTAKVGPVKVTMNGEVTLSDIDPPNGYRIAGEGKAGPAGYVKGGSSVRLTSDGDGTVLGYTVDAALSGKLAQMGSRVIDAAAKKMADDFFTKFSDEVTQGADRQEPASEALTTETPAAAPRPTGSSTWWILAGAAAIIVVALAFFG